MKNRSDKLARPFEINGDDKLLIVGIGASAGGIPPLKEFFKNVKADSGMVYVVILHLSPSYESQLAEILQINAKIPVRQIKQRRIKVKPNCVYVIAPNKSLTMQDGYLALEKIESVEERRAPIDIFFRTLAQSHGERAVSVILSGTGANGSSGIRRIKEFGGIVIVQDSDEAEFNEMPLNSIATGLVDCILPVAEIPAKIADYRRRLGQIEIALETETEEDDDEKSLREIFTHLRVQTGHDFTNYKRASILRRIERRINVRERKDLREYVTLLREQSDETQALLKDLLISVTNFFRDKEAFDKLKRDVLPTIFKGKKSDETVRVWVAGCATGEEAYSLAMLLSERASETPDAPMIQIFATDIDEKAIVRAREGFYTLTDAADVSPERLQRFFHKEKNGYRVRRELREVVLFALHNIIKDAPFSQIDFVTCRNLLIYLNRTAQERVMQTLHFALKQDGFLFLGSSESNERNSNLFVPFDREHHIFQSHPLVSRMTYPVPEASMTVRLETLPIKAKRAEIRALERLSYIDLHQQLLEQYAPPSLILNTEYDILHLSATVGKYLHLTGGEPNFNLLKIARSELRLELRSALYQAVQSKADVKVRNLTVQTESGAEVVNIHIRPVLQKDDGGGGEKGFILVIFEPSGGAASSADEESHIQSAEPVAAQFEQELIRLKAQLRLTIDRYEIQNEEYKASNEELQAINEELRSAAEELETGKEELQSVNEELTTVNQELKIKIDELSQSNNDLQNLMSSTNIGTIFLDRDLRINLFTPSIREIFSLIPSDISRLLTDINSKIVGEKTLFADIGNVLETLQPIEREVKTREEKWFFMQISPYRTAENKISGTVLTFLDITKRKQAEFDLSESEKRLRVAMESARMGTWDWNMLTGEMLRSPEFNEMYDFPLDRRIGSYRETTDRIHPEDVAEAEKVLQSAIKDHHNYNAEMRLIHADNSICWVCSNGRVFYDQNNQPVRMIGVVRDITKYKEAEEELLRLSGELRERVEERTQQRNEIKQILRKSSREHKQIDEARVALLKRLVTTQEDERRRIARDLHDHLGQQMTALRLQLKLLKDMCEDQEPLSEIIGEAEALSKKIDGDVGFLAWELRPTALDDLGLVTALKTYVQEWSRHFNVSAEFHSNKLNGKRLSAEIETTLYRIGQEALNNVLKHAEATQVSVLLEYRNKQTLLIVEDDGKGFNPRILTPESSAGGMGINGMRERAALVGGTLEIESKSGSGSTVYVRIPSELFAAEN